MKKEIGYFLVSFMVLGIFGFLGPIHTWEITESGEVQIHTVLRNSLYEKVEGVRVSALIPELDVYITTSNFDLRARDVGSRLLFWEPEDVEPGIYFLRVVASGHDWKDTKHTWISVE